MENKENNPNQLNMLNSQCHRAFGKELSNLNIVQTNHQKDQFNKIASQISQKSNDGNCSLEQFPLLSQQTSQNQMMEDESKIINHLEQIDIQNINNPQMVSLYASQIYEYLRVKQNDEPEPIQYMVNQTDINEKMRAILIDWLIDVHVKFKLIPETLFLTVNIIDRFLEKYVISRVNLQLLGVTAMLIACKYEEIYSPEVKDFVYVTDNAYTKPEILEMEGLVLLTLDFDLTRTSAYRFLERYSQLDGLDQKNFFLAQYLLEISFLEYKIQKYKPLNLACSALYLVNKIRQREPWSETLQRNTQLTEQDVRPCAKELCVLLQNIERCSLQAVKKKFNSSQFMQVSRLRIERN